MRQRQQLRLVQGALRAAQSEALCRVLAENALLRDARAVAAFVPLADEPQLKPWLAHLLCEKPLYLPRVSPPRMEFCRVASLHTLQKGALGVWQPPACLPASALPPRTVVLVPGLLFDAQGGRLGRGGGYYDRYLAAAQDVVTLGVALQMHLAATPLPLCPHDVRMHYLATPQGILTVGKETL